MGNTIRKIKRDKLKGMKGDNDISGAWGKYQEITNDKKKKHDKKRLKKLAHQKRKVLEGVN